MLIGRVLILDFSMVSPSQCEEGPSRSEENSKENLTKISNTSFKVSLNVKKTRLHMFKPDMQSQIATKDITYPIVCLKEDSSDNEYAFRIMHSLNHENILSLKVLCENKLSKDPTSVATFVEPFDGLLWPILNGDNFVDKFNHIPSPTLQNYLSQIAEGIDFLRKNKLHHGNLSWDSTLYHGDTVKLAGFKSKESVMSDEDAQWYDWTCYLQMLQGLSLKASQESTPGCNYFCGHLDSLIGLLQTLDKSSLSTIKDIVLENIFFWKVTRRLKFFSHTISLKLKNSNFMKEVNNSGIRGGSWDQNCTINFSKLLKKMNDFREARAENNRKDKRKGKAKDYDGDSMNDYVRVICGACTHWRQLELDVDGIIRENHPTIYIDVKKILELSEEKDFPRQFDETDKQGYHTQGHDASSHRGPHSQSQRRDYGYLGRGMPRDRGASSSQRGRHYQSSRPPRQYHEASPSHRGMFPPEINPPDQSYRTQGSQPFGGQAPMYAPVSRNYNTSGQSQVNPYGQPLIPQLHGQPPVAPQHGYPEQVWGWQALDPYVHGAPFTEYQQAGVPQGGYVHPSVYPNPNYRSVELGAPFGYCPQTQSPFGYYPLTQSYYGATVPAAGQDGYASVPAAGQSSTNAPGYASAPAAGQSAHGPARYSYPPRNP